MRYLFRKSTWLGGFVYFFPLLCFASSSGSDAGNPLNFTPPPSDVSIVFLGNIFGVVDGVLHGTGSQIMGNIFGVFNAAILSFGGIVVIYATIMATMNTAQEGEILGRKWSSMWIPLRVTSAIVLLLPKASGYCLMQILIMWVVTQGVGAADKIWGTALDYLNRGGVIIQPSVSANYAKNSGSNTSGSNNVAEQSSKILTALVCMQATQASLNKLIKQYDDQMESSGSGLCSKSYVVNASVTQFCEQKTIPDFATSVDFIAAQQQVIQSVPLPSDTFKPPSNQSMGSVKVPMPNFKNAPFKSLNGICGTVSWNLPTYGQYEAMETATGQTGSSYTKGTDTLTYMPDSLNAAVSSKGIAIQQVYNDLFPVAYSMVNNAVYFNPPSQATQQKQAVLNYAYYSFGIPETENKQPCVWSGNNGPACVQWGVTSSVASKGLPALFNGTEIIGSVNDYNNIMQPALKIMDQDNANKVQDAAKDWLNQSKNEGWILAGSYFFDLVSMNNTNTSLSKASDSGFTVDIKVLNNISAAFNESGSGAKSCAEDKGNASFYCQLLDNEKAALNATLLLITGNSQGAQFPTLGNDTITSAPASAPYAIDNVYAFAQNSYLMQLPGQPGLTGPYITPTFNFNPSLQPTYLPWIQLSGGWNAIPSDSVKFVYNLAIRPFLNAFIAIVSPFVSTMFTIMFMPIIILVTGIFSTALAMISIPGINPVVALANMGAFYINQIISSYFYLAIFGTMISLIPIVGVVAMTIMMMVMLPLLLAFFSTFMGIGIMTAYYVPLLPYMIFTFAAFGWMFAVIEAMVAGPIIALGMSYPEGEDFFGKAQPAIMIIVNVFLRPSLMIIGFIVGIILTYVGIWLVNAGFQLAIDGMLNIQPSYALPNPLGMLSSGQMKEVSDAMSSAQGALKGNFWGTPSGSASAGSIYTQWAGIIAFFFLVLIYTTMYIGIVTKSFEMITLLPDRVLRWIGGGDETTFGSETAGMAQKEVAPAVKGAGQQLNKGLQGAIKPIDLSRPDKPKKESEESDEDELDGEGGEGGAEGGETAIAY